MVVFVQNGYLVIDDSSDYIGLSRLFFRNHFHIDQSVEFWWPPLYYFLISPILSSVKYQDFWIYLVQSAIFGFFVFEFYFQLGKKILNFSFLHFVAIGVFLFSIPGLIKYFITPHPEGLYLILVLLTIRNLESNKGPLFLLLLCSLAYLTKYATLSLLMVVSLHAWKSNRHKFLIPLGCLSIFLTWTFITFSKQQSHNRTIQFLWTQKHFDFSGPIHFFLPFSPIPEWSLMTTLIGSVVFLSGLMYWYVRVRSPYILFAFFTFILHLATHFLADPASFFDERLFLPSAVALSMAIFTGIQNKKFLFFLLAFGLIRLFPTANSLSQNIEFFAKKNLLKTPHVQFLQKKEAEAGSLCLIFLNKNHSCLFEQSKSFRLFRLPITAKPDASNNLRLAKDQGFSECYLVQRHFCPETDILCNFEFKTSKKKVYEDDSKSPNGADIYRIRL